MASRLLDVCPGPASDAWSSATSRGPGCSIRIRINASRHDSRQEPYAVVPHLRICAGGGEQSPSLPRPHKQEFGLSHYEGRGWRGFHYHATLCIAAYGFLVAERLRHKDTKKNALFGPQLALPENYVPRGRSTRPAARAQFDLDATVDHRSDAGQ